MSVIDAEKRQHEHEPVRERGFEIDGPDCNNDVGEIVTDHLREPIDGYEVTEKLVVERAEIGK